MIFRPLSRTLLVLSLALQLACSSGGDDSATTNERPEQAAVGEVDPSVVATFTGGTVSRDDLQAAVLALAPAQRAALSNDLVEGHAELIREHVYGRILRAQHERSGQRLSAGFLEDRRRRDRDATVRSYLLTLDTAIDVPTEAEVKSEFDRRRDEFYQPEKRLVSHIFVRSRPSDGDQTAEERLREIRRQVVGGQGFEVLARQLSESESRSQDGRLGWFQRGQLPQDLEQVVFALEELEPSEVVSTQDGAHLFLVQARSAERPPSFEAVKGQLSAEILDRRTRAAMDSLMENLNLTVETFVPTPTELQQIRARQDPSEVVLRVGDASLTLGQLEELLSASGAGDQSGKGETEPMELLQAVKLAELLYQHAQISGFELTAEQTLQLETEQLRLLENELRAGALDRFVDDSPERVRAFFEVNRQRFLSPLRAQLVRLRIPRREDQVAVMAELETLREPLDRGAIALEELAERFNGSLQRLGPGTVPEFRRIHRAMADAAASLQVAQHSPPFTTVGFLEMAKVEERLDPAPIPFEQVSRQVRDLYVAQEGQQLYAELREAALASVELQILSERLAAEP